MPTAVHVPRVNNNDDEVKLIELKATVGSRVEAGEVLAVVETDKAMVDVEAPQAGFVLAVRAEPDAMARVGSVLLWLGATADEQPPADQPEAAGSPSTAGSAGPTAKALVLLARYGLSASQVPASGARLSAEDVERHAAARGLVRQEPASPAASVRQRTEQPPVASGRAVPLAPHERGMLATVTWHRDDAVAGYIEFPYDGSAWDEYAKQFATENALLLNPMLSLMAWRLAELAQATPRLNATIVGDQRHEYHQVNLGFTVQAGDVLYLAVIHDAIARGELEFVKQLQGLQRRAAGHQLTAQETQGATIGFSSMARWEIGRHIPVLAPRSAVMVAHATTQDGRSVLGATYDHRVLHGAAVAAMLRALSKPRPPSRA